MIVKHLCANRGLEAHYFQTVPLAEVVRDVVNNISILLIPSVQIFSIYICSMSIMRVNIVNRLM